MQIRHKKKVILSLGVCLILALSCFFAVFFISFSKVKADVFDENGFVMNNTAGIRVDEEFGGMRFTAKIGTARYDIGKTYGMLIFPYDYLEKYITEDNYIEEFEKQNVKIINLQPMTAVPVDENGDAETDYYVLKGVISNILYSNLNREFIGIAYYLDGETPVYASIDKANNNYSVVSIAEKLLSNEEYLSDLIDNIEGEAAQLEFNQLYSYIIKGKNQARGVKEDEIVEDNLSEIKDYYYGEVSTLDNAGKTNVLASFDSELYYAGLLLPNTTESSYKNNSTDVSKREIIVDENTITDTEYVPCGSGVLKLSYAIGGTAISLPRKIVVESDTLINFKVFSHGWYDFTVSGEKQTSRTQKTNILQQDAWVIKSILATDLGYAVGDTISELEIYISSYVAGVTVDGYFYLDEITYSKLNFDLNESNGEVANYNTPDYTSLTMEDRFDIIEDDSRSVLIAKINGFNNEKMPLAKKITVTENSNVIITYKSDFNLHFYDKTDVEAGSSIGYKKVEYNLVEDLGFSIGDEITYFTYRNQSGTPGYLYIDDISCIEKDKYALNKELTGYQVANFDNEDYSRFVTGGSVANGEWTATTGSWSWSGVNLLKQKVDENVYEYNTIPNTATGKEGYVVFKISMYKPDGQNCRFYVSKTNGGGFEFTSSSEGDWTYNITNTSPKFITVILPVSKLGYSAGETFEKMYFAPWNNNSVSYTYSIDYIEYVELPSGLNNKTDALYAYLNLLLGKNLEENEVANYNDARYLETLTLAGVSSSTEVNYQWHGANQVAKSIDTVDENSVAVIKSLSGNYACAGFKFIKDVTVTKNTVLEIKIKSGNGVLRVSKFGADSIGVEVKGVVKDTWTTVSVFATDVGYQIGDTVKGLDLYFGPNCGTYNYIDYIAAREAQFTITDNKVIDFADVDSTLLVNAGTITDSVLTYSGSYAPGVTIKFADSKTVKAGDFVAINIKGSARVSSYDKDGNMFYVLEGTPNYANWSYPISDFSDYNTLIIPAEKFVAIGSTLSSIRLTNWDNSNFSVKWIKYVSFGDGLSDNQVVNFTDNNSSYLKYFVGTAGLTYDDSISTDYTNYEWHQRTTAFEYAEISEKGSAKFTCSNTYLGGSIRFIEAYNEVTANTVVKLNVYTTDSNLRLAKYKQNKTIGNGFSNKVVTNQWISIFVKATDIGYAVGDKMVGFNFFASAGSGKFIAFSDIEVYEYEDKLELSGNQIMNFENINNMNYANNGAYNSTDKALIHGGLYEAGAVTISFKESHTVSVDDVIAINIYAPTQVRILTTTNSPLCVISSGSLAWEYTTKSEYQTIILPLAKLGYSVGEEFSSIKITNWASGSFRVKWIEYIDDFVNAETKDDALKFYNNGQLLTSVLNSLGSDTLMNYDVANSYSSNYYGLPSVTSANNSAYQYYSTVSTREIVTEGFGGETSGLFKFHNHSYGGTAVKFLKSVIVTETNYLEIKIYTPYTDIRLTKLGDEKLPSSVPVPGTNDWTVIYVKLTDLGYSVGEVVKGFEFYVGTTAGDVYIDYIKVADVELGLKTTFDFAGYALGNPSISYSADQNYQYWSTQTTKSIDTENGIVSSTNDNVCGGYFVGLPTLTVTDDMYVRTKVQSASSTFRLYKSGVTDTIGDAISITANEWVDVEVKLTDIGYLVGDKLVGLNVYIGGAYTECSVSEFVFYTK